MIWGSFGRVHIATLILAALMIALVYVVLKNRKRKTQTAVPFVLSFVGNAATVYNLVAWGSPLEYLPLHLCALNGLLLPVAVTTRNRKLWNLLPCEYLYMLLAMPIIAVYLSAVYAPQMVRNRRHVVRCTMPPL